MKAIGLIIALAAVLTLQGCSSDSNHHHSQSNEAVYPADIESLHATYFKADGLERSTVDLDISYADDGKITDQVIIVSLGGTALYTTTSLYNSNGDMEQETFRDDLDEETTLSYYSYNTVDDLIEKYRIFSPDDSAAAQQVVVTTYLYNIAGNVVSKNVTITVDNVLVRTSTVTTTYNGAGQKELSVVAEDIDADDVIDRSMTESFTYDEDGRLASTHSVSTGLDPSETTNEYTYNDDGLIAQRDTSYDDGSDGQLDEEQTSVYRYVDIIFPSESIHTKIDYDADETITTQAMRVITYSYDGDHFLLTYLLEDTDQLNSDQLMNSERWDFSYNADGRGVTTESWVDANGDGESFLAVTGELAMHSANTLNQLYHFPLEGDVYHAVPLSFAIASGLIFE